MCCHTYVYLLRSYQLFNTNISIRTEFHGTLKVLILFKKYEISSYVRISNFSQNNIIKTKKEKIIPILLEKNYQIFFTISM